MANNDLIKHLNDKTFDEAVKQGVTLVDFHAEWCGPCRMLAPVLEQVAKDMQGKATVVKVDIDHAGQVAAKFRITSVPTMIVLKNGVEVNRLVGLKNAATVKAIISAAL